nr:hypothetical protein CFP56_24876 [Quercus suber]
MRKEVSQLLIASPFPLVQMMMLLVETTISACQFSREHCPQATQDRSRLHQLLKGDLNLRISQDLDSLLS